MKTKKLLDRLSDLISGDSGKKKAEIETKLKEVNELVVTSHGSFDQARDRLKKVQDVVPMQAGDVVSIEAVPGRMFDMLIANSWVATGTWTSLWVSRNSPKSRSRVNMFTPWPVVRTIIVDGP